MISLTSTAKKPAGARDLSANLTLSMLSLSPAPGDNEDEHDTLLLGGQQDDDEDGSNSNSNDENQGAGADDDDDGGPEDTGATPSSAAKNTWKSAKKGGKQTKKTTRLLRPSTCTTLTLRGADIAKLLQRKPELAEFLDLQIREMNAAQTLKE